MTLRTACLGLLALAGTAFASSAPPSENEVAGHVRRLGDESFEIRAAAFEQLEDLAGQFPLHMFSLLASQHPATRDLEIRHRLERLLRPLAERILFAAPPGFIGINMEEDLHDGAAAVRVLSVLPGHAGEKAGLREGDLILAVEGLPVAEMGDLQGFSRWIAAHPPGILLRFDLLRAGAPLRKIFPLDARPEHLDSSPADPEPRFREWLRQLDPAPGSADPRFPIGHFPLEDE
jgi:hypothetical protein